MVSLDRAQPPRLLKRRSGKPFLSALAAHAIVFSNRHV
jgi:hypothetical protein